MWIVRQLESKRATLDFSSSGQGSREVTHIIADEVLLANAAELSSWNENRVQLLVCEACGIEHCEPGGWLSPRRAGTDVVFAPAFSDMLGGESERTEYAPPRYVTDRGVPLFGEGTYASLRRYAGELPLAKDLPALSGEDLVRCLQWDAPMRALGTFPEQVALRRDCLLAVSEGDLAELTETLEATIRQLLAAEAVTLVQLPPGATTRTFYLDGPGAPEWPILGVDAAGIARVRLGDGRLALSSVEDHA